ncbi:MAG: hypothetical protein K2N23_05220, partial [Clostridia bacterium]|nr:hypothetical protein [Clostridia bacterium]
MKKRKIAKAALAVLSIMTIGASGASLAACGKKDDDKHEHSYGSWYIVTEPTLTDDGTIARDCVNNDDKQTNSLPKLTDTSVWTENKGAAVDATHTTDGSRTFDSEYGSVTVTVPKDADAHTYGKWTITKEPTMTAGGKASHTCSATDAHVEEVDIPALSDSKVWTKNTAESVAATHTKDGKDVFDSVYGKVEVTVPASADAHDWGEWTITKNPTLTEGGKASHTCKDTDAFEKEEDIPALSNSEVWTENAEKGVPATCMAEGKRVFESVYGEVEITVPVDADAHDYGAWNFVENKTPTLTEAGKIQRVCGANKDHIQTEDVPALSDADFWAKTVKTAPTHQDAGVANFINATYKIAVTDVVLDKVPHTFGEWTITTKPTMTETGEAKKVCTAEGCAEDESATETKVLPALSDTTVWTAGEEVEADYDHVGSITYTSVYGSVTVKTADKLAAPYDDKIYSAIEIKIDDEGSLNTYVWGTAFLHVGNEGAGEGSGFPFNGSFVFKYTDPATGKITMINTDNGKTSEIEAYVDATTGIIAMPRGSWDDFFIAVPAADETAVAKGDFKISACMGDFIITHGDTTNILVTSNGATFNVTFEDIDGNALVADTCFDIT